MRILSEKLARFIERHPLWYVTIAVIITAAAIPGLTMLETETGFSALISEDAEISVNDDRYQEKFGGYSINVMLTGQLDDLFSIQNLASLSQLEQELSQDDTYLSIYSTLDIFHLAIAETKQEIEAVRQQTTDAQEQAAEGKAYAKTSADACRSHTCQRLLSYLPL